ncbi:MAG: universal stress protein [Candidatus Bathyarchaeia archaeon]
MFKSILLPTDGSQYALKAGKYAIDIAKHYGSRLLVVYVVPMSAAYVLSLRGKMEQTEELFKQGERSVEAIKRMCDESKVPCEGRVVKGDPALEVLRLAEAENVDLLVVGARRKGRAAAFTVGSVSDTILAEAPCPVMVVGG